MRIKLGSAYLPLLLTIFVFSVEAQELNGSQELIDKLKQSLEVSLKDSFKF
jgi:hypothetical protein